MQRVLAIDYGAKRVGLALSDLMQIVGSPFKTITNNSSLILNIQTIIKEKEVGCVIVGLPKSMKGQKTAQTEHVLEFVEKLKDNNINVELIDERLSSISATKALVEQGIKTGHNKSLIDQTAAAIFLQQYLDTQSK